LLLVLTRSIEAVVLIFRLDGRTGRRHHHECHLAVDGDGRVPLRRDDVGAAGLASREVV
jgi:hypothetical protein